MKHYEMSNIFTYDFTYLNHNKTITIIIHHINFKNQYQLLLLFYQMKKQLIQQIKNNDHIEIEEQQFQNQPKQIKRDFVSKKQKKAKKDLLRIEKTNVYNVYDKDKYAEQKQFIIKKLIQQKQKPKFEFLGPSPLLKQIKSFLPLLKQANDKFLNEGLPTTTLDANLHEEQSSDSEESEKQIKEKMQEQELEQQQHSTELDEYKIHSNQQKEIQIVYYFLIIIEFSNGTISITTQQIMISYYIYILYKFKSIILTIYLSTISLISILNSHIDRCCYHYSYFQNQLGFLFLRYILNNLKYIQTIQNTEFLLWLVADVQFKFNNFFVLIKNNIIMHKKNSVSKQNYFDQTKVKFNISDKNEYDEYGNALLLVGYDKQGEDSIQQDKIFSRKKIKRKSNDLSNIQELSNKIPLLKSKLLLVNDQFIDLKHQKQIKSRHENHQPKFSIINKPLYKNINISQKHSKNYFSFDKNYQPVNEKIIIPKQSNTIPLESVNKLPRLVSHRYINQQQKKEFYPKQFLEKCTRPFYKRVKNEFNFNNLQSTIWNLN